MNTVSAQSRPPTNTSDTTTTPDPFLFDNDQLDALAPPALIRAALRHCNDNRVTALDRDEERLWAEVEDEELEEPFAVTLTYDPDGNLLSDCNCQRDPDEGTQVGAICVHGIAALFAYGKQQGDTDTLRGALEEAIDERVKKGRSEVRVEPLATESLGSGPVFGTWSAQSIQSTTHFAVSYRVHLRSLIRRANYCTCPDFAVNQLGTCKHIEAVLHRIRKCKDFKKIRDLPPAAGMFIWTGRRSRRR